MNNIRLHNFTINIRKKSKFYKKLLIGVILFSFLSINPSSVEKDTTSNQYNRILQNPSSQSEGINDLSYIGLLQGDIVLITNPDNNYADLVPGLYSHVFIYCGRVLGDQQIWDRDNSKWMDPGTPYVIHSSAHNSSPSGLGYSSWTTKVNRYGTLVQSIRIIHVNQSQRVEALNWMITKLSGGRDGYPVGPVYDWGWSNKQISGKNPVSKIDGYYCSEIVWAAYKDLFNIDLDPDGTKWDLTTLKGVSPTDLLDSNYSDGIPMYFGNIPEINTGDQINSTICMWVDMNNDTNFTTDEIMNQCTFMVKMNSSEEPLGLIQNILGLTIAEQKEFLISADVDEDGDGIDDLTNHSILGYKSGEYANKSLKYIVEINAINEICLRDIPTRTSIPPIPEPTEIHEDTVNRTISNATSRESTTNTSAANSSDSILNGENQKIIGFNGIFPIMSLSILAYVILIYPQRKRKNSTWKN